VTNISEKLQPTCAYVTGWNVSGWLGTWPFSFLLEAVLMMRIC